MSLRFEHLTPDEQAKLQYLLDELRARTVERHITWGRFRRQRRGADTEYSWQGERMLICLDGQQLEVFDSSGRRVMDLTLTDDALWQVVRQTHADYLDALIDTILEDLK